MHTSPTVMIRDYVRESKCWTTASEPQESETKAQWKGGVSLQACEVRQELWYLISRSFSPGRGSVRAAVFKRIFSPDSLTTHFTHGHSRLETCAALIIYWHVLRYLSAQTVVSLCCFRVTLCESIVLISIVLVLYLSLHLSPSENLFLKQCLLDVYLHSNPNTIERKGK